MSFSTYLFIFAFLPITLLCYFLLGKLQKALWQKLFLIAASLVFYAWGAPYVLIWLAFSGAVSFGFARLIERRKHPKLDLWIGVLFNVALLCAFKYLSVQAESVKELSWLLGQLGKANADGFVRLIVPVGMSFYVFQQLCYLIEVYKEKDHAGKLLDYVLFITLFPYRLSGPIARHSEMDAQFHDEARRHFQSDNFAHGAYLFVLGLAKKLVLADTIAVFANNVFSSSGTLYSSNLGFLAAWVGALSYTLQLYFDFSGYSDMALGVGKMLNFDLPRNFDSPYKSESVSVFWRKWHMTLGKALTICVYIPLGGNRKGKARTCLNLFLVMCVSGIWHGASVNFLLWGAAYGLIMVFERLTMPVLEKIPKWIRVVCTFLIVNFLWVPFRAETIGDTLRVWRAMFSFTRPAISQLTSIAQDSIMNLPSFVAIPYALGLVIFGGFLVFACKNSNEKTAALQYRAKNAVWIAILFALCVIHLSKASVFLYSNF